MKRNIAKFIDKWIHKISVKMTVCRSIPVMMVLQGNFGFVPRTKMNKEKYRLIKKKNLSLRKSFCLLKCWQNLKSKFVFMKGQYKSRLLAMRHG